MRAQIGPDSARQLSQHEGEGVSRVCSDGLNGRPPELQVRTGFPEGEPDADPRRPPNVKGKGKQTERHSKESELQTAGKESNPSSQWKMS